MPARTILFVIPSLKYSGAARQLSLLAAGLSRQSFCVRVAVLGIEAPWVESLRGEGIEVEVLGWRRPFDVLPFAALRRLVKSMRPDIVHVWGATALSAVVLTGSRPASRLFVSAALSFAHETNRLDRWLLSRAGGVIAFGTAEAERYRRLGVADSRLTIASPAMPPPSPPDTEGEGGGENHQAGRTAGRDGKRSRVAGAGTDRAAERIPRSGLGLRHLKTLV